MTAGNSTPLSDGASAVLLASEEWAAAHEIPVQAFITEAQTAAVDYVHKREGLLMAPAYAMPRMLARAGVGLQEFDFYEIHEVFASQVLCTLEAWEDPVFCRERLGLEQPLGAIDRDRLNVHGGSLAAGHPFGSTGGRIVSTLAKELSELVSGRGGDLGLCGRRTGGPRRSWRRPDALLLSAAGQQPDRAPDHQRDPGSPTRPSSERYQPGQPVVSGPVLLGRRHRLAACPRAGQGPGLGGRRGADRRWTPSCAMRRPTPTSRRRSGTPTRPPEQQRFKALLFDASGDRVQRRARARPGPSCTRRSAGWRRAGRVIVLGTPPEDCAAPPQGIAQRALEGLPRAR